MPGRRIVFVDTNLRLKTLTSTSEMAIGANANNAQSTMLVEERNHIKVTRKLPNLGSLLSKPQPEDGGKGDEMAPNLYLSHLPSEIENMPEKGDFEGHIKGKVKRHTSTTEGGKTHHSYDLDVHHFECHNKKGAKAKPAKKGKSVEEAFKEYGPKEKED